MEYVFKKIIEIDNRAKEIYEEAVAEKEQMKNFLAQDISKRENEIREMKQGKIDQLTSSGQRGVDEKLEWINRQIQEKLLQLENEASTNAKKWEEFVFSRVIGD
ncbi:MAG: hypothetical protein KBA53_09630 [Thermoclostridium sp.]|nr:hypothetical protein [Thermoclostridium sp.]